MTTVRNTIIGALALVLTSACSAAGSAPANGPRPAEAVTTVEVMNNNWSDMRVYAVRSGIRMRLGTVTSMTTDQLKIPRNLVGPGADLQLIADPIGGAKSFNTGPIVISRGQRIELTIQNHLAISDYAVWSR